MIKKSYLKANLLETISSKDQFKTLREAIRLTGLENELKGEKKLTLFAPTDEAFSKLPPGTLDSLLN